MLTMPVLTAPVARTLPGGSRRAEGADQAIMCPGAYCPTEGADQAIMCPGAYCPTEGVDD